MTNEELLDAIRMLLCVYFEDIEDKSDTLALSVFSTASRLIDELRQRAVGLSDGGREFNL